MHRSISQFALLVFAISATILASPLNRVLAGGVEQSNRDTVLLEVRKLSWEGRPPWGEVVFLGTYGKSIVAQYASKLFLLSDEGDKRMVHLRSVRSVSEVPSDFTPILDFPIGLRARVIALQMLGIEEQEKAAWYYDETQGLLYSAVRDESKGNKWEVRIEKRVHPIADLAYSIAFEDLITPRFSYWNGTSYVLFSGGQYSRGYSFPFRFDRECVVMTFWSEMYPEETPTVGSASADLGICCDGHKINIPTTNRRFYGPFVGLDGSVSLVVEEVDDWLWYCIR